MSINLSDNLLSDINCLLDFLKAYHASSLKILNVSNNKLCGLHIESLGLFSLDLSFNPLNELSFENVPLLTMIDLRNC